MLGKVAKVSEMAQDYIWPVQQAALSKVSSSSSRKGNGRPISTAPRITRHLGTDHEISNFPYWTFEWRRWKDRCPSAKSLLEINDLAAV